MKRISMGLVVLVVAVVVINKDRIVAKLRSFASSPTTSAAPRTGNAPTPGDAPKAMTLPALRKALKTTIGEGQRDDTPPPEPPAGELEKVYYDAPLGKNVAYVTPVKPGARRAAIVWIHGGFNWGIDDSAWTSAPRANDQSAANFRKAGIAEMYPALRGGSQNPGHRECFLGEIDDVLAAAEFLAKRPDVDPQRIYLGGHSTGGLIALLAAESTPRFRAVFAFGPVADPRQYGKASCVPSGAPEAETKPRSALEFLSEIVTPTFVIDGANGNAAVFPMMQKRIATAPVSFLTIPNADHFDALAPACDVVAKAILADTGDKPAIHITADAIAAAMRGN
jgi:dipeptidyl aminopeptidase/acylaminoacyl peptidase